ncbi:MULTISPECIES: serine O-acetyltransferase [Marinomonas]|uniref:Serine acetyltransferase n=1 Tax=Marinomonas aquiplantarum TaxID=491951 RepID=A0A366D044_9GAMM|nr:MULTISPECIES: serine O-acetyltransferase [Marinomonas]KZN12893.1 serine acetyltransferase [Marinomonas sp. TW1]RBO83265.1 serine O-acetyltransferase [Marinomonas aquiplantarum]
MSHAVTSDNLWQSLQAEAKKLAQDEPILASYFNTTILRHDSLCSALSFLLASKLDSISIPAMVLREVFEEAMADTHSGIVRCIEQDILAINERDAACDGFTTPLLFFKGFHALQTYRVANWLWKNNRRSLALYLQGQMSMAFSVDIHPAATIGCGVMLDHATGLVVGETCVIEDNVSILQSVTLGGTGKEHGDRHPKIRSGVLIGAGAKILGNIEVGEGAKVGAGSVVLEPVEHHTTVAGVPAKVVGRNTEEEPALVMDHNINHCLRDCDKTTS